MILYGEKLFFFSFSYKLTSNENMRNEKTHFLKINMLPMFGFMECIILTT